MKTMLVCSKRIGGLWAVMLGAASSLLGQIPQSVEIFRGEAGQVILQWEVQRLTPIGSDPLFADYLLEQSVDLKRWKSVGDLYSIDVLGEGRVFQEIVSMTENPHRFFRIRRQFSRPFANLIRADLTGADLTGADLFGADLFGATLPDALLMKTDLSAADLRQADLRFCRAAGATFFGARLFGATLENADLREADLSYAEMDSVDLFAADLTGADLRGSVLNQSNLRYAILHQSKVDGLTQMPEKWRRVWTVVNGSGAGADFRGVDFSFAELRGADFSGADLSLADLSGANLDGADLSGTNFENANLRFVTLKGVILTDQTVIEPKWRLVAELSTHGAVGRRLPGVDLSLAFFVDGSFSGANLEGADLSGAIFFRADLSQANLENANLFQVDLGLANLRQANLNGANLAQADLSEADLTAAEIEGANFNGTIFLNTIMPDGTIQNPAPR